jgi:hypothetical protein
LGGLQNQKISTGERWPHSLNGLLKSSPMLEPQNSSEDCFVGKIPNIM